MFSKFRTNVRDLGLINTLLYLIDKLLGKISKGKARIIRYYLVVQPVPQQPLLPSHRGKEIYIRELLDEKRTYSELPRPYHVIKERFKQNGHCLAAYKNNTLLGFIWLNFGAYQEDEVRCRFIPTPNEIAAWDYDMYIEPSHRLSLAFIKLWNEANNFLQNNGKKLSMSRISAFNSVSLASHARLGSELAGVTTFLCIGKIQIMIGNIRPYIHLSLKSDSYPYIYVGMK